jgi:DNA-binding response OmpR family regulator
MLAENNLNIDQKEKKEVMNNSPKRILVVDDDPDIRIMIKIMLEFKGYSVVAIERGDASEEMMMTGEFGLVIMDMLLSGMNGVDICAHIKQNQAIAHIPIVMISAHPNARATCLEAGADEFIAKPFDMQEILLSIKKLMPDTQQ